MFKVNNKDTGTTPLAFLLLILKIFHTLLTYVTPSMVNFEHVIADWVGFRSRKCLQLFPII